MTSVNPPTTDKPEQRRCKSCGQLQRAPDPGVEVPKPDECLLCSGPLESSVEDWK